MKVTSPSTGSASAVPSCGPSATILASPCMAADPTAVVREVTARGLPRNGAVTRRQTLMAGRFDKHYEIDVDDIERLMNCIVEHAGSRRGP